METEILTQLLWIKWLLFVIATALVTAATAMIWAAVMAARSFQDGKEQRPFAEVAKGLIEKESYADARALCEKRYLANPGDSHAFWYHGLACYRLGDFPSALRSLRKAKDLQPDWAENYISPLIAAIEAQGGASKAELRVIRPDTSGSTNMPPDGGAPISQI